MVGGHQRDAYGRGHIGSRCNEGFAVRNVHIRNMDVGIKRESCFSDRYTGLDIRYISDVAIWTPAVAQGDPTNDGRFSDIKIQNIAFVKADGATSNTAESLRGDVFANRQIGMLWQQSGGDQVSAVDIIATGSAIVVQPMKGKYLAYLRFTDVLADGSQHDNWTFDASEGGITRIVCTSCWGAFSKLGSGLVTLGPGLDGLRWTGGDLRENGQHGAHLQGGRHIEFNGTDGAQNSHLATDTYDGLLVEGTVSYWSVIGGSWGNHASGLIPSL